LILTYIYSATRYTYKTEISILKSNLRIHYMSYIQMYFNLMMSCLRSKHAALIKHTLGRVPCYIHDY